MRSKKAVSEVVSVVLIIMITVAAIAVLWTIVIPMVKDGFNKGSSCFSVQSDVTLLTEGYTCINRTSGNISVQVRKGADDSVNLVGLNVLVVLPNGNSVTLPVNSSMPGLNEERTYVVGNESYENATEVKIAPIIKVGKVEQACDATQKVTLEECSN